MEYETIINDPDNLKLVLKSIELENLMKTQNEIADYAQMHILRLLYKQKKLTQTVLLETAKTSLSNDGFAVFSHEIKNNNEKYRRVSVRVENFALQKNEEKHTKKSKRTVPDKKNTKSLKNRSLKVKGQRPALMNRTNRQDPY